MRTCIILLTGGIVGTAATDEGIEPGTVVTVLVDCTPFGKVRVTGEVASVLHELDLNPPKVQNKLQNPLRELDASARLFALVRQTGKEIT